MADRALFISRICWEEIPQRRSDNIFLLAVSAGGLSFGASANETILAALNHDSSAAHETECLHGSRVYGTDEVSKL